MCKNSIQDGADRNLHGIYGHTIHSFSGRRLNGNSSSSSSSYVTKLLYSSQTLPTRTPADVYIVAAAATFTQEPYPHT